MSHEMTRHEAEEEYGKEAVDNLEVTTRAFFDKDDIVDVWPLLPDAETVPTTEPRPELVGSTPPMLVTGVIGYTEARRMSNG